MSIEKPFESKFGMPARYVNASLNQFSAGLISLLGDLGKEEGYFLTGGAGVGKTHLAAAILNHWVGIGRADRWIENGTWMPIKKVMAQFVVVPELLQTIRSGFESGNADEIALSYARQQVLVLDDLGAEKSSDWTFTTIYSVLAKRINYVLPTIVTSNMTIDQLRQWEPRIASRLSGLKVITMEGKDKRKR